MPRAIEVVGEHGDPLGESFTVTLTDPATRQRIPQFQLVKYRGQAGNGGFLMFFAPPERQPATHACSSTGCHGSPDGRVAVFARHYMPSATIEASPIAQIGAWVAEGDWTAGLAAWRLGDCTSAADAFERTARSAHNPELNAAGYKTRPYHAGLADEERIRTQEAFRTDKVTVPGVMVIELA